MGAESGVDGARWAVDHSNSGVVSADATGVSATTSSDDSDGSGATETKTASKTCNESRHQAVSIQLGGRREAGFLA